MARNKLQIKVSSGDLHFVHTSTLTWIGSKKCRVDMSYVSLIWPGEFKRLVQNVSVHHFSKILKCILSYAVICCYGENLCLQVTSCERKASLLARSTKMDQER